MRVIVLALVAALGGCMTIDAVHCADGRICPHGSKCDDAGGRCIAPSQIAACDGQADGSPCTVSGANGECMDGACEPFVCGNGIVEGIEQCDGPDLGGADCTTLGYYDAPGLRCNNACRFDTGTCTGFCGDHAVNGGETCDGEAVPNATCVDYGFDVGVLGCSPLCSPNVSGCGHLGWEQDLIPGQGQVRGIWASGPRDIYLVGAGPSAASLSMHYDGTSWTTFAPKASTSLFALGGTSTTDLFAVGSPGVIEHWNGTAWADMTNPFGAVTVEGLYAAAPDDVFAVGQNGKIAHYNGASWTSMTSGTSAQLNTVWGRSGSDVWAAGISSTVLHYTGSTWSPVTTAAPSGQSYSDILGVGASDLYLPRTGGVSHFDGASWTEATGGFLVTAGAKLANAHGGTYYVSSTGPSELAPNGHDWLRHANVPASMVGLSAIGSDPAGHLWVGGLAAGFFTFTGATWLEDDVPTNAYGIWGTDPSNVLEVGGGGSSQTCTTYTGGYSWKQVTCSANLRAVWGTTTSNAYGVGSSGTIQHFDGASWSAMTSGTSVALAGVWGSGAADIYAVGAGGTVLHSTGATWTPVTVPTTDQLDGIWGADATHVFVVGAGGRLLGFDGAQWTASTIGDGSELFAVWGLSANDVWTVGAAGEILHFDGATWSTVPSGTPFDLYAVWGTGPRDVFAGGLAGTLLHWDGAVWSLVRTQTQQSIKSIWGSGSYVFFAPLGILHRASFPSAACAANETTCGDLTDDDCDFLVDCADPDCSADPACGP